MNAVCKPILLQGGYSTRRKRLSSYFIRLKRHRVEQKRVDFYLIREFIQDRQNIIWFIFIQRCIVSMMNHTIRNYKTLQQKIDQPSKQAAHMHQQERTMNAKLIAFIRKPCARATFLITNLPSDFNGFCANFNSHCIIFRTHGAAVGRFKSKSGQFANIRRQTNRRKVIMNEREKTEKNRYTFFIVRQFK